MRLAGAQACPRVRVPGRAHSRGQSVVEFALLLPVAMLLLVLIVDVGRLFYTYVGVTNAAREGAAYGMQHPTCWSAGTGTNQCADPGNITYLARQELGSGTALAVTVQCAADCTASSTLAGNTITVTASQVFAFLFPIVPQMTISSSATAVIQ